MLKCWKRRLYKALSILLAAVLTLTLLPAAASAADVPAFAEGYPKLGAAQAVGSKKIEVLVKGVLPGGETEMGLGYVLLADGDPAPTAEQLKSAGGKIPGTTVITWGTQILGGIETAVTLTGAQDDTNYEFYAVCWKGDVFSEVEHLAVKTPVGSGGSGDPVLAPPTGLQWDTAGGVKGKWNAVANATSYAVTLYKVGYSTMLVQYPELTGTEVSFQSNIVGYTGNYYFTVQAKAAGYTSSLKPASPVYSYAAPLYGNAMIDNMSPKIGDTLTGSLSGGNNTGTLHYAWKAGGSQVGADAASYTVTAGDLGKTITLDITSSVETGTRTSAATAAVLAASSVWNVKNAAELEDALNHFKDGDTIRLTANIDYSKGIVVDAKTITLDVGSFTLNVSCSTGAAPGVGLNVINSGHLNLAGSGAFNVTHSSTGSSVGVYADSNCSLTVTNVKSVSGTGIGAYASGNGSVIRVLGNVEATGSGAYGAATHGTGEITIDGIMTATSYTKIYTTGLRKDEGVPDGDYLKYALALPQPEQAQGSVRVKIAPAACQIENAGGTLVQQYDSLPEALAAATDGQYVRLLQNIIYEKSVDGNSAIKLSGAKTIYLQMNNHNLAIRNTGNGSALEVATNAKLWVGETGDLTLDAKFAALNVSYGEFHSGGAVNATLQSTLNTGINADHAIVDIEKGALTGVAGGIYAGSSNTISFGGPVTVNGQPTWESHGVHLGGTGNTVSVNGNINVASGLGTGVYVQDGGTVTVGHKENPVSITSVNGAGIWTRQGSNTAGITVYGNVTGKARAIDATGDADIKVFGNVKSTSAVASVYAVEGFANSGDTIAIAITGNVEGPNGVKYHGNNGTISVTGNVTAIGSASDTVGVFASYGSVSVTGNVASPHGIGAEAGTNGQVTIDGVLTGNTYVKVYYESKTADDKTLPTTKANYHTYSHPAENATVWVKDGAPVTKYQLTVENGTGAGSYLPGVPVNITANDPASGKVFDKWITSGGGSFGNANSAGTTFTMPSGAVTVTATYKDAPVETYTLTVSGSYAGTSGAGEYTPGAQVSIHAGSRSNYSFTGWTSPDGITFANAKSAATSFTMPSKAVSVTASWNYSGGGGGGVAVNASITPQSASFDIRPTESGHTDISITLSGGSYSLSKILLNGKALVKGTDYTVSGSTVTFKEAYLATLEAGKHEFTFDMSGGADPVLSITIINKLDPGTGAHIPFEDVSRDDWFASSVMWAFETGPMKGISEKPMLFNPHGTTTRGMIATILHRLENTPGTLASNPFADVAAEAWYGEAVVWAAENKIVSGYGKGQFGPGDAITREQLAVILMNYAKRKGYDVTARADLSGFTDVNAVSVWAMDAISWANATGLIQGDGTKLNPTGSAERCQIAAILQRFIENIAKEQAGS